MTAVNNPLIVALDLDKAEDCLDLADRLKGRVGAFKIGPRLTIRYGAHLVSELAKRGPVFVDNKYFDIPSTMEAAVKASFDAGASLLTVHASSGADALKRVADVEARLQIHRPVRVLAVTILTSFTQQTLPPSQRDVPLSTQVQSLAQIAHDSGISGLVCSAAEVADLRSRFQDAFLVTPGIRLASGSPQDQARVTTPREAKRLGASALVVGRPIIEAKDPVVVAEQILAELQQC